MFPEQAPSLLTETVTHYLESSAEKGYRRANASWIFSRPYKTEISDTGSGIALEDSLMQIRCLIASRTVWPLHKECSLLIVTV